MTNAPVNSTSNTINYFAVLCAMAVYAYCRDADVGIMQAALLVVSTYGFTVLLLEALFLRTPWRASAGLDFSRCASDQKRTLTKLLGLYGSLGFVGLLYWLLPEYHSNYYTPYWNALAYIGSLCHTVAVPWFGLLFAVPYVWFVDERMKEPYDSYYYFGRCLLGQWRGIPRGVIAQHLLGWVVKGFFLPIMFCSICQNLHQLQKADFSQYGNYFLNRFPWFYGLSQSLLYTLDLLAAVAGYVFSLRLFDTHQRSAEPTLMGWTVCLVCYPPLQNVMINNYLAYPHQDWMPFLNAYPLLQKIWGCLALLCLLVYTLATIHFGCRFSNLTHRGVMTNGVYRLTKHPAYVSKSLMWWMVYVPFIPASGWSEALRFTLLMAGINVLYYLRARTEEAHLSRDPDYVAYALHMNEHSVFRHVGALLPFLRYKPPTGWKSLKRPYEGIKHED